MWRAVALLACLALPVFAQAAYAQDADCKPGQHMAQNRDGVRLRITTECGADAAAYRIEQAPGGSSAFTTLKVLEGDAMFGEPYTSVGFLDLEEDGDHEIEARGMCSAGPNCLGEIYRLDAAGGELELFFASGYSDLVVRDGHLIESGRASCCSWEYHAWNLRTGTPPLGSDNMDFMITVGADVASEADPAPVLCTFSRRSGDNWQVIEPPFPSWRVLCEMYGEDYLLVTPEEAQAAEAALQEQHNG